MAERLTIARPYAEAVFALARDRNVLAEWSRMLALMAGVAGDARVARLATDPKVTTARLEGLLLDICGDCLNAEAKNFLRVLISNRRLLLLPEIASHFELRRNEAEGKIDAEVATPFPLTGAQTEAIAAGLKRRLGREVRIHERQDKTLVGGVVIRAGDLLIDGSVRGMLERLSSQMIR